MIPVLALTGITKTYGQGDAEVHALRGVDLEVHKGDYVAIMGASGSGKSTLMNIVGALDNATTGHYELDGINIDDLDESGLSIVRNRKIGFIFQSFNLIPRTTALSNVELPLLYRGVKRKERHSRAVAALEAVGLHNRMDHEPNELSGGQQQRVAVARALVAEPSLLLADEPTGNLDSQSTRDVLDLMDQMHTDGRTIVMITHEDDVAARADRVITLIDGLIADDYWNRPRGSAAALATSRLSHSLGEAAESSSYLAASPTPAAVPTSRLAGDGARHAADSADSRSTSRLAGDGVPGPGGAS